MTKPYRVLLYYKYVPIENAEQFRDEHLKFCKELGLKGRILIADEGINGTLSGPVEKTDAYIEALTSDERFKDTEFKIDEADGHAFKKMHVRYRPELVNSGVLKEINPNVTTGKHLSPEEFYEAMKMDDVVIIDARNDYEYDIGHFRGAIRPDIQTFRELPEWIKKNREKFEGKKILTYCTGGIRCEKFSGFLKEEGFEDVNQLHGGIINYSKNPKTQGQLYDGKCYVFDERISVPINQVEDKVVGKCYYCGKPEDRYVNCANPECNLQHVACPECEEEHMRSCSDECREHPRNRYKAAMQQQEA
ncbi:rhodanese-related sulfurtransferase [Pseudalkalibacillus sp. SCS-8]|uniref:oxygen-dependent tRNA uridine(34) hydroxylase TrhO n=1 Tax=Pseudalkalibacillus nanhaiensis TaxID=3115291 RepID=UPI0032D9D8FF